MWRTALWVSLMLFWALGCGKQGDATAPEAITLRGVRIPQSNLIEILKLSPLPPVPPNPTNAFADREDAAVLGQFLFFEARLSGNGQISCATCHQPALGWSDGKALSEGIGTVVRNSPTLWNVAYNRWYFWDGRKDSLWSQSLAPMEHPQEMGGNRLRTFQLVAEASELRGYYEAIFGPLPVLETVPVPSDARPVSDNPRDLLHAAWMTLSERDRDQVNRVFANLGKSIEAYERRILTRQSPFDRFVAGIRNGDRVAPEALSAEALRGMVLFTGRGQCILCHLGPNFTDREFHNIGLDRGGRRLDIGRFQAIESLKSDEFNGMGHYSDDRSIAANAPMHYVTRKPNNLGEFKTPTLRNVAETAPYMHDGRFESLSDVVRFYSTLNQDAAIGHREESLQPLSLTEQEVRDLVAFLNSLTGVPLEEQLISRPTAPLLD